MGITDYNMDIESGTITTKIRDREVLEQWIQRAILTERNTYPGYSSNYGVEIEHLKNKDINFILANIQKTITDAILVKPEIKAVYDFSIRFSETEKDTIYITFLVETIYGMIEISKEKTL